MTEREEAYFWDFWYVHVPEEEVFHIFSLNAPRCYLADETHHFHSRIGHLVTPDFKSFSVMDNDVLSPSVEGWDNTSMWTGDVIRTGDGYLMFYTSRDGTRHDGRTQEVGAAFSPDLVSWRRLKCRISADTRWYMTQSDPEEGTIHAWRDPFLFLMDGRPHMLMGAKAKDQPPNRRGAVALLRATSDTLLEWEVLPPLVVTGWHAEMDVPQLYRDEKGGYRLLFSGWARDDKTPDSGSIGGLRALPVDLRKSCQCPAPADSEVLVPEDSGLYSCRILPELGGQLAGFSIEKGMPALTGVSRNWSSVDRDFSRFFPGHQV